MAAVPEPVARLLEGMLEFFRERFTPGRGYRLKLEEMAKARQLAGVWNKAFLTDLFNSLDTAIMEGRTVREWIGDADAILAQYTPRGVDVLVTPGGERGEEFSSWYGDLVFRMAAANGYAAGRYTEMWSAAGIKVAPYWEYSAIHDERVRPEHLALDGMIFRKDDPDGNKYLPPWDFNCRCMAFDVDAEQLGDKETVVGRELMKLYPLPEGFDVDRVRELVPQALRDTMIGGGARG